MRAWFVTVVMIIYLAVSLQSRVNEDMHVGDRV